MRKLTLDEVREALPELDELRPVLDHLLARSEPDPERMWAGSGELGTVGSRLVDAASLGRVAEQLATAETARLTTLYDAAARALAALAAGDRGGAADALLDAAAVEERGERPERSEAYAAAAHRVARAERDQHRSALALRRWARAARAQGRLADALERYERSHEAALALRDHRGAAEAAIGAGNVLEEQGRWQQAADWYRKALEALDEVAGPAPERWHALLNLHIAVRSRGALEESVGWLDAAARAAAETDPEASRAPLDNAAGQLLMARGSPVEAEARFRAALDQATGARARVTVRLNLAECLLARGRTLDAAEHAREAEREAIRAGLVPKLPEVYRLLGRVASAEGNPDAFVLFERALEITRDRGLPALEEALTLQAYAEAERRRGESDAARQLHDAAAERFAALGITRMREPWADVFGTAPMSDESLRKEQDGDEA